MREKNVEVSLCNRDLPFHVICLSGVRRRGMFILGR